MLATSFDVHTTSPSESSSAAMSSLKAISSTHVALGAGLVPQGHNEEIAGSPSARLLSQVVQDAGMSLEGQAKCSNAVYVHSSCVCKIGLKHIVPPMSDRVAASVARSGVR